MVVGERIRASGAGEYGHTSALDGMFVKTLGQRFEMKRLLSG
jgi:hypothetical protein